MAEEAVEKTKKRKTTKKSVKNYMDIINAKKTDAHNHDWLYIEICAKDLLAEVEDGADNIKTVCKAMLKSMLEGDGIICEPRTYDRIGQDLAIRYYCDNLDPSRAPYFE